MATWLNRRKFLIGTALTCMMLSGCGDDPPASPEEIRDEAFIAFLKQNILDQDILSIPRLTTEQRQAFGILAGHYDIIVQFHDTLSSTLNTCFPQIMEQIQRLQTLPNLQRNWQSVSAVRDLLNVRIRKSLDEAYQVALNSRQSLIQSEKVKPVFNDVFIRSVEAPVSSVHNLLKMMSESLDIMENMGSFLDDNRDNISFSGILVQAKTPTMQEELNTLMKEFNFRAKELQKQLALFHGQFSQK